MSDFVMQIGADLDLSKVQEQLDSIKKQKVTQTQTFMVEWDVKIIKLL